MKAPDIKKKDIRFEPYAFHKIEPSELSDDSIQPLTFYHNLTETSISFHASPDSLEADCFLINKIIIRNNFCGFKEKFD